MADRTYDVSELLCYLCYKYSKCNALALKTSIVDFYSLADISAAKEFDLGGSKELEFGKLAKKKA